MAKFPLAVFSTALDKAFLRTIRPPSKKHLGTELRKSDLITTTVDVLNDQFSMTRGLPALLANKKDPEKMDLGRKEDGTLEPSQTTATVEHHRVRLQEPQHLESLFRFQDRAPDRGMDASVLVLPKRKMQKLGARASKVAMAAGPFTLKGRIPRGKARFERLPSLSYKTNVVMLDENADVTFGSIEYPPWVRRQPARRSRLRLDEAKASLLSVCARLT